MSNETTLYKKDQKGQLRYWSIAINYMTCELEMYYGVVGGEAQYKSEEVSGNSVRDDEEQLEQRFATRVHNKIKGGYLADKEEAMTRTKVLNLLGLAKPMLACRYDRQKKKVNFDGALLQLKYDGHRCIIANVGGEIIAYSKNGISIATIPHITEILAPVLEEGMMVDGELYHHRTKLQTISSWVKRSQDESSKLSYVIYDVITDDEYGVRYGILKGLFERLGLYRGSPKSLTGDPVGYPLSLAPTLPACAEELPELYKEARLAGFEGLMIRLAKGGYEDGKRSKNLLKVKTNLEGAQPFDDEFKVVGIKKSKDGWAILICELNDGTGGTFNMSAPGDMAEKTHIFNNKQNYLGRSIRAEFADYTKDRKPFHAVATGWRDKPNE